MPSDLAVPRDHTGGTAVALGVTSATAFVVGWGSDHRYVPPLFSTAPIVALAGLAFAATALRRDKRATAALIGGTLSLLVLLGYVYALLAYVSGGN